MKSIKLYILITMLFFVYKNTAGQGIVCNPNSFWGRPNGGNVNQYTLTGSTVVFNGFTPSVSGYSLAICNNLDGGLFSPTFYTSGSGNLFSLVYYTGSNWVATQDTPICKNLNAGGYGNFLYILDNTVNMCIQRYVNNSFTSIFNDTLLDFTVADIAVDEMGNIWTFRGQASPNTEYIFVIDSTGQVIKQYPFNLNTNNAFGCFMLNDILYLGFGTASPIYPSSLLPISFTSNTATIGIPIPFVSTNSDLASCDPGNPLSLDETYLLDLGLLVFPTVTTDNLNVIWNAKAEPGSLYELKIFDISGRIVHEQSQKVYTDEHRTIIDVKNLSSGIYTVQLTSGKYHSFRKFIKN